MALWNMFYHAFRWVCLKAAGESHLLQIIEMQKAQLTDLQKRKNVKGAIFQTDLFVDDELKQCTMRVNFYMPDDTLHNIFCDHFASMYISQTETFLKDFNENFADVCIDQCCGTIVDNVIPFPTFEDDEDPGDWG